MKKEAERLSVSGFKRVAESRRFSTFYIILFLMERKVVCEWASCVELKVEKM